MLSEERIKEAEGNVKRYLEEGLIKKEKFIPIVFDILLKNARESIEIANLIYKNKKSSLWIIVCSYYSMYYIANAVLYKSGYKIGHKISHKVTSDALITFVRFKLKSKLFDDFEEAKEEALELAGLKADELIENFDFEREKRSKFQYEYSEEVKRSKAETSLKRAKEFVFELEKLL